MATFKPRRTVNDLSEAELRSLVFSVQKLIFGAPHGNRWPDPDTEIDSCSDIVSDEVNLFDRFGLAPKPAR